jgi:hypothetical protein
LFAANERDVQPRNIRNAKASDGTKREFLRVVSFFSIETNLDRWQADQ